jgi:hypothetical protein
VKGGCGRLWFAVLSHLGLVVTVPVRRLIASNSSFIDRLSVERQRSWMAMMPSTIRFTLAFRSRL